LWYRKNDKDARLVGKEENESRDCGLEAKAPFDGSEGESAAP
jgi:hypothetical protein